MAFPDFGFEAAAGAKVTCFPSLSLFFSFLNLSSSHHHLLLPAHFHPPYIFLQHVQSLLLTHNPPPFIFSHFLGPAGLFSRLFSYLLHLITVHSPLSHSGAVTMPVTYCPCPRPILKRPLPPSALEACPPTPHDEHQQFLAIDPSVLQPLVRFPPQPALVSSTHPVYSAAAYDRTPHYRFSQPVCTPCTWVPRTYICPKRCGDVCP